MTLVHVVAYLTHADNQPVNILILTALSSACVLSVSPSNLMFIGGSSIFTGGSPYFHSYVVVLPRSVDQSVYKISSNDYRLAIIN
jgi:hypothetical protein